MPPSTNKPPKGYEKKSWQELIADFTQELTNQKITAEGDAIQLQVNINDKAALISVARKYDRLAGQYDGASNWLQAMLRGGKKPKTNPPNLEAANKAYDAFEAEANVILAGAYHGPKSLALRLYKLASPVPSLGDIAKIFDSIMKAIEWFLQRGENERYALADLLQNTMLREWIHVTDSPDPPVHTAPPGTGGISKDTGNNAGGKKKPKKGDG